MLKHELQIVRERLANTEVIGELTKADIERLIEAVRVTQELASGAFAPEFVIEQLAQHFR